MSSYLCIYQNAIHLYQDKEDPQKYAQSHLSLKQRNHGSLCSIVEAWNFDFTVATFHSSVTRPLTVSFHQYHQVPGTNLRLPMMSMSDSNVGGYQSSVNPLVQTANEVRAPTLGEVKGSIRVRHILCKRLASDAVQNMVHKLIAITQTLEDLPSGHTFLLSHGRLTSSQKSGLRPLN
jgi:hypothetical protein